MALSSGIGEKILSLSVKVLRRSLQGKGILSFNTRSYKILYTIAGVREEKKLLLAMFSRNRAYVYSGGQLCGASVPHCASYIALLHTLCIPMSQEHIRMGGLSKTMKLH